MTRKRRTDGRLELHKGQHVFSTMLSRLSSGDICSARVGPGKKRKVRLREELGPIKDQHKGGRRYFAFTWHWPGRTPHKAMRRTHDATQDRP